MAGRKLGDRAERILFALVANRPLAPSSKLAATGWVSHGVHIDGFEHVVDEACYRAMGWLGGIEPALAEEVYHATAHLLDLEVDLLFFDATSTYFQVEQADELVGRDEAGMPAGEGEAAGEAGFRSFGKSKDHRDVAAGRGRHGGHRDGIPVRCWCWPGNTADSALIRQVRDDMRSWNLARIVWVADRGFASAANRRHLQRGAGHYILGERLRGGTAAADAALSQKVRDNLQVKEVKLGPDLADDRFVVCFNPHEAGHDAAARPARQGPD